MECYLENQKLESKGTIQKYCPVPSHDTTRFFTRRAVRRLTWLATAAVSVLALGLASSPASAGEGDRLLSLVNSARARAGLPAVAADAKLNSIASEHAQRMASAGRIYHNSSYPSQAEPWQAWGENVGSGPSIDEVHKAFMQSPTHRANILSSKFDLLGVGVATYSGGIMVVQDFLKRPGTTQVLSNKVRSAPARPRPPPPPPPPDPLEPVGCHWVAPEFAAAAPPDPSNT